ncbi:MAG: nucleotidyl transferase AbiEii/AbiGii toxin family protein [Chthoniobacterales bacterium]
MNDVFHAAAEVQRFCQERGWEFCFIGGLAVQRWADPRQTEDADLTLLTGFFEEESFVDALLENFEAREDDEREKALLRRVVLVRSSGGIDLDIALGALPFEEHSVRRATSWRIEANFALITCTAEDLIVHKAFASRDLDWADVRSTVMRQGRKLNVEQIWAELRPLVLLKEEPEILVRLQKTFDQHLD